MNQYHILQSHHEDKPTLVIGEICSNGCQTFHRSKADKIFSYYNVSTEHQQDVMELFDQYNPNEDLNLRGLLNDPKFNIRFFNVNRIISLLVERYPSENLRDTLFNSKKSYSVIEGISLYSKQQLDSLVRSNDYSIRKALAKYGDKEILDILLTDHCWIVRYEVACRGYRDHLDELLYDKNAFVRGIVVEFGIIDHLKILVNDKEPLISNNAKESLEKLQCIKSQ